MRLSRVPSVMTRTARLAARTAWAWGSHRTRRAGPSCWIDREAPSETAGAGAGCAARTSDRFRTTMATAAAIRMTPATASRYCRRRARSSIEDASARGLPWCAGLRAEQRREDAIQLAVRPLVHANIAECAPMLGVGHGLAGRERHQRSERLELEKVGVGERLIGAAEIGVLGRIARRAVAFE